MAIGMVSDREFDIEKDKLNNHNKIINNSIKPGRKGNAVPESLRNILGEESVINGRSKGLELASSFGVSSSSLSAYSNGAASTKTYDKKVPGIVNHINKSKLRISNKAKQKLHIALDNITDDKLSECKVTDVATVAKQMSSIMKDMEPDDIMNNNDNIIRPQIIIYSPMIRTEESYEVIEVRE